MRIKPNNYFFGGGGQGPRPCECCKKSVKTDTHQPAVYGSGRFCSAICAKLRTPEAHWNWLVENPEELEKWQEWIREQDKKKSIHEEYDRIMPL